MLSRGCAMALKDLRNDIDEEVAAILASDFNIDVTETRGVPHFADGTITFPNLDRKYQGTKLLETTVLYVDMRRSTQLSFQHRRHTVAKLYSAFVRAIGKPFWRRSTRHHRRSGHGHLRSAELLFACDGYRHPDELRVQIHHQSAVFA
jgi:adenylate cyclase